MYHVGRLRHLELDRCTIPASMGQSLLTVASTLQNLVISSPVDDADICSLAGGLCHLTSLSNLVIRSHSSHHQEGNRSLVAAAGGIRSLRSFSVCSTDLGTTA